MKKNLLVFCFAILGTCLLNAQNFWKDTGAETKTTHVLELDFQGIQSFLADAPMETSGEAPLQLTLPMPDGSLEMFAVVESPALAPALAARFPSIKSYAGIGLKNPQYRVRFDTSPNGFHGAIYRPKQSDVYIEPQVEGQLTQYLVYKNTDTTDRLSAFNCGLDDSLMELPPMDIPENDDNEVIAYRNGGGAPVILRVYRLAVATTGEFATANGGSVEGALATINTAVTQINEIFAREVAVKMELVENTDAAIYLVGASDPYPTPSDAGSMLSQNVQVLNNLIGVNNYDIGHLFTRGCDDGIGGIAGGQVCTSGKGAGVTCHRSGSIIGTARGTMAHEIAHQFSVAHSWNNCPGSMDQLASGSAFEPGSGSTIMSYNGACGAENNIPGGRDSYYHGNSIQQFIRFSRESIGNECATPVATGNNEPIVMLPYQDGFHIPISTPFILVADAEDPDGDEINYCWEQMDLGPSTDLGEPRMNSPLFRTYEPRSSPRRTFPEIRDVLNQVMDETEVLPTYSRDLTFRCTVRDLAPVAGTVWQQVKFRSDETAGPFVVTSFNSDTIQVEAGSYQEVTWDVANTDNALVNCKAVNILMSLDGGFTNPITLATNTRNDGSEFVTIPNELTNRARIKVEAADNIFFDTSNKNFEVIAATAPTYTLGINPSFQQICLPSTTTVDISSGSFLGFDSALNLDVVDGLPEGAVATFGSTTLAPGESTSLTLDLNDIDVDSVIAITVRAIAADADTAFRTLELDIVNSDFSALALVGPTDGTVGLQDTVNFTWMGSSNANSYDFELATSPTFGETVVESATGLRNTSFEVNAKLIPNVPYFWRVRALNECGVGEFITPFSFYTVNVVCSGIPSEDVPVFIPNPAGQVKESVINVPTDGTISDINIPMINISYSPIRSLKISLTSPSETEVVLYDGNCFNTNALRIGFDDEAITDIQCPPTSGLVQTPVEPLSTFAGESTRGLWTLTVETQEEGFGGGGELASWNMEFCGSVNPSAPFVVNNELFKLPSASRSQITKPALLVEDTENSANELVFTLLAVPTNGTLYLNDRALEVGDQFRQSDINAFALSYEHDGSANAMDRFNFIVEDGEGGYLGGTQFNIEIDESATVNINDPVLDAQLQLFPNPTEDAFQVEISGANNQSFQLQLLDVQGRKLQEQTFSARTTVDLKAFPAGIYFVNIQNGLQTVVRKVVKQ